MSAAAIHFLFLMRNQIKLYHWQTHLYSRHTATDNALTKLDENIDEFVEVYGEIRQTQDDRKTRMYKDYKYVRETGCSFY